MSALAHCASIGTNTVVYMSYCNCWDYLLLHEDWGECSEDWAGACRCRGGGGGRNVPGVLKRKQNKIPY